MNIGRWLTCLVVYPVEDLKANTEYTGYTLASPVVLWFWEAVRSFNKEDMARLLQFITGTSKVFLMRVSNFNPD
jgi:hypothetical protein